MTVIELRTEPGARVDPFALAGAAAGPGRRRLLSYVGRWGRACRWLPADALRVLDVGCSFGYGSAAIGARGPSGRVVVGVERDPEHLAAARRRYPWITIIDADATELPVADACADAVTLLDVIEHIPEPERVIAEVHRVLRPGGVIVVSVPHRGPLRWLDALNLYDAARRRWPSLPPLEAATESGGGIHRHFGARELEGVLAPWFSVDRVARTGLGLQELVMIGLIVIRVPLRMPALARVLVVSHLLAYMLDDLIPTGPLAYHLEVRGQAVAGAGAQ